MREALGHGGNGEVWCATHPEHGLVALKLLRVQPGMEARVGEMTLRLFREAELAQSIRHANVLSVLDHGVTHDGVAYLAMELLEGQNVGEVLARKGRLDPATVCTIGDQVLAALEAVHGAGIVHRDLKPENLFVHVPASPAPASIKLIDFGIACSNTVARMTRAGAIVGTPYYLSPEQALGEPVDARADLYSVGVLLYELLSGRTPFEGLGLCELMLALVGRDPEPLTSLRPGLPKPLVALVHRALRREPDERPRTASIFRAELALAAAACGLRTGTLEGLTTTRRHFSLLDLSGTPPIPLVRRRAVSSDVHEAPTMVLATSANRTPGWVRWAVGVLLVGSFGAGFASTQLVDVARAEVTEVPLCEERSAPEVTAAAKPPPPKEQLATRRSRRRWRDAASSPRELPVMHAPRVTREQLTPTRAALHR